MEHICNFATELSINLSQFFHRTLHFSVQAFVLSTTHLLCTGLNPGLFGSLVGFGVISILIFVSILG
jgi:hypothetical protein